jgi:hypothetical protein
MHLQVLYITTSVQKKLRYRELSCMLELFIFNNWSWRVCVLKTKKRRDFCIYFTFSILRLNPLTQEHAMNILGFFEPFDDIKFGPFTGNATLMK